MRLATIAPIALLVMCPVVAIAQTPPPDLKAAMDARVAAGSSGDEQTWARYTTDDFIVVNFQGLAATKAQRMAEIKGTKAPQAPSEKISEESFRIFGDTVIRSWRQDRPGSGPMRWVSVWVKQNGVWRMAHQQQTSIPK